MANIRNLFAIKTGKTFHRCMNYVLVKHNTKKRFKPLTLLLWCHMEDGSSSVLTVSACKYK